jgi:Cu/Ag efflux pump CusA
MPKPSSTIILEASAEMRGTIFFATMITLLAVLPIFFLEGMTGALFGPLALSYALAVIAAMVAALTLTPALSLLLLSGAGIQFRESPLIPRLQRGYERLLSRMVKSHAPVNIALVVLIVAGLAVVPFLRRDPLLPSFQEPYLTIQIKASPATSLPEMNRIVARMSDELRSVPGVENVGAHVGRAVFGDQVVGINSAELWVGLADGADYEATVGAVQETAAGYPGLALRVETYLEQRLSQPEHMVSSEDITLRVYGEEFAVLRAEAEKLEQSLAGIEGVSQSRVILPVQEPTVEIEVDLAAAQKYGVKPGEVRRTAAALLSGILVGSLFEQQKVFDVLVWGAPEIRRSLSDIQDLMIQTPAGGLVRLGDVADVRIVSSPTVIQRAAVSPYLDVAFNVSGRSVRAVAADIQTAVRELSFPLEYHAEVLNNYAARQTALERMILLGLIVLVGMFLLLQAATRSWNLAFATFLTLPAALVGGLLASFLGGTDLSLASLFGLLTVLGIGARNGITLINHYQRLELEEGRQFGADLVLRGSSERVAPILLTAFMTGLALLPFVIFGGIPGQEMIYPMAVVIMGGLVTSTLVNLFVLPALYLGYGASREPDLGMVPVKVADLPTGAQD